MDELVDGDGDAGLVGAELEGSDGALEGNVVEDDVAAKADEEAAAIVVDGDKEDAVGGGDMAAWLEMSGENWIGRVRVWDLMKSVTLTQLPTGEISRVLLLITTLPPLYGALSRFWKR